MPSSATAPARVAARERFDTLAAVAIVVATTLTAVLAPLWLG
jgi:hypothetical protein